MFNTDQMFNVRYGSLAASCDAISHMTAFGPEADVISRKFCCDEQSAISQKRTLSRYSSPGLPVPSFIRAGEPFSAMHPLQVTPEVTNGPKTQQSITITAGP
jgi:hypothetical protein